MIRLGLTTPRLLQWFGSLTRGTDAVTSGQFRESHLLNLDTVVFVYRCAVRRVLCVAEIHLLLRTMPAISTRSIEPLGAVLVLVFKMREIDHEHARQQ